MAGKDFIQEPFLSEDGATALLHAMLVLCLVVDSV